MKLHASFSSCLLLALLACGTAAASADGATLARGKYLAHIMDCNGCHTPGALRGRPDESRYLAGSDVGFGTPPPPGEKSGGVVYPKNLTPDRQTGIGTWTVEQIVTAVRTGRKPDGTTLIPVMPWPSYSALTDEDAHTLAAYLKSLPPIHHQVPANVPPGQTPTHPYLGLTGGK